MAGWADVPGATDQDQEDARTAIAMLRRLMDVYKHPSLMAPHGTFTNEEISFMLKLKGDQ